RRVTNPTTLTETAEERLYAYGRAAQNWVHNEYESIRIASRGMLYENGAEYVSPELMGGFAGDFRDDARAIVGQIRAAEPNQYELWRGATLNNAELDRMRKIMLSGETYDLPISSFSDRFSLAEGWGWYRTEHTTPVLYDIKIGNAKAVQIWHLSTQPQEGEWLTFGQFRIT